MTAIRMQFFTLAAIILVGILLTGFENAHWFSYFPVLMLLIAGITGVCPGLKFWQKMGFE